jgi:glycosyltransferase involved in cell wall biosynthesis
LKIVYFSYLYDIKGISAGSANKALGFLGGLRRLGHDVRLYWRESQPEAYEGNSIRLRLHRGLKKRLSRTLHDPKTILKNCVFYVEDYRILRREKPDLLFLRSELYNVSAQLAARRLGIPVVLEADSPTAYEHRHMSSFDMAALPVLPEWAERWNCKTCRAVITISDVLRDYLVRSGAPASKITVVPNAADPDVFRPLPGAGRVRARLGIPKRAVVIGWMQSGWGLSGIQTWISVARRILSSRSDAVFMFIGGGKNRETIEKAFVESPMAGPRFLHRDGAVRRGPFVCKRHGHRNRTVSQKRHVVSLVHEAVRMHGRPKTGGGLLGPAGGPGDPRRVERFPVRPGQPRRFRGENHQAHRLPGPAAENRGERPKNRARIIHLDRTGRENGGCVQESPGLAGRRFRVKADGPWSP